MSVNTGPPSAPGDFAAEPVPSLTGSPGLAQTVGVAGGVGLAAGAPARAPVSSGAADAGSSSTLLCATPSS